MGIKGNKSIEIVLQNEILPILPLHIAKTIESIDIKYLLSLEEIRLRAMKPLMLTINNEAFMLTNNGEITRNCDLAYYVTKEDINKSYHFISQCSVYSFEEELKNGYITISGGHRVGFSGHVILENNDIKAIRNISSLNIRIAREIIGAADKVLPYIVDKGRLLNALIISPPKAGKTTLLRDLIRQLSNGVDRLGINGINVGLVDERSEIACCYEGVPQNDVGMRTDVLDGCPKAKGIMMLLRSMSPDLIVTDEIGKNEDALAIEEVINAGVAIIATVHGSSLEEIKKRPTIRKLINRLFFDRYIILSKNLGVGKIEAILDSATGRNLIKIRREEKMCG